MRVLVLVCALLGLAAATPATAQIYPYLATLPVPKLLGAAGPVATPQGLAYDSAHGRLLAAEGGNQVVQIFDGTSFAVIGTIGIDGAAGGDAGHLSNPGAVAVDTAANRFLVADTGNSRVQIFASTSFALLGTLGVSGVPGSDNGHLSAPAGVAADTADGRIVVADTGNHRVQIFDARSLAPVGTIGVTGVAGNDNAHLSAPQAVAIDPATGHLLIADSGNARIQVFNAASAAFIGTIGQTGAVSDLAVDVAGRRVLAVTPNGFDALVIDADHFVPIATIGLTGGFGIDNAHFLQPSGAAADAATGRVFVGDAALNRIQIFGPPSVLVAAVAPTGRAVPASQPVAIFATVENAGTAALGNCRVSLPDDAPAGLALSFQPTNPATNRPVGLVDQPVAIAAGQGQSFVLTLTAATPLAALGQSFLFTCDGTTPAPVFAGINTADITFTSGPTADIVAAAATPGQSGVITVPQATGNLPQGAGPFTAFPIAAFNIGTPAQVQVSSDSGSFLPAASAGTAPGFKDTLPITVLLCQTNPLSGACLAQPAATLTLNFPTGATATFSVFVTATAPIPNSLSESRLFIRFTEPNSGGVANSVGSSSVAVTTVASQ